MSERAMRKRVLRALKPLHAVAVENPAHPGTPDVNYIEGWLELKKLKAWPKSDDAPVALEHFAPQQRIWLRNRTVMGGSSYMLLQVGNEWLLFTGRVAADIVGRVSRRVLYLRCLLRCSPLKKAEKELLKFLRDANKARQ